MKTSLLSAPLRARFFPFLLAAVAALAPGASPGVFAQRKIGFRYEFGAVRIENGSANVLLRTQDTDAEIQNGGTVPFNPNTVLELVISGGNFDVATGAEAGDIAVLLSPQRIGHDNLVLHESDGLDFDIGKKGKSRVYFKMKGPGECRISISRLKIRAGAAEDELGANPDLNIFFSATGSSPAVVAPPAQPAAPAKPKPESEKEKAKPEINKAKADFEEALKKSPPARYLALQNFLEKHPASPEALLALQKLPVVILDESGLAADTRRYRLKYATGPLRVDTASLDTARVHPLVPRGPFLTEDGQDQILELRVSGAGGTSFYLLDPGKEADVARTLISVSGQPFHLELRPAPNGHSLVLRGGTPPYIVQFLQDKQPVEEVPFSPVAEDREVNIPNSLFQNKNRSGKFAIRVRQDNGMSKMVPGEMDVPPPPFPWVTVSAIAAVLALGGFLFLRYRHRTAREKAVVQEKIDMRKTMMGKAVGTVAAGSAAETTDPALAATTGLSGFRIKNNSLGLHPDRKAMPEKSFNELLRADRYQVLSMGLLFGDSALSDICFHPKPIRDIDQYLGTQRDRMADEQAGNIPEIGGFLMGRYTFSEKSGRYRVALQEFVPIMPEVHTVYQLQFSTESIVRELGDMQDQYPDLNLVGWFHTHPGHGLFLSKPDLTIHDGFFREPYQFAMEIDSLTKNLDTGFFTRTLGGKANNQENLLPGARWFDWTEIDQRNNEVELA